MEQVIFGGWWDFLSATDTEYNSLNGGTLWADLETYYCKLVSTDGVIKNLRAKLSGTPGAGTKYTFTLMLNGNPTALTFDIADTDTTGGDMINEVVVTGGDTVSIRCVPTGPPTARYCTWTSVFKGDTAKESLMLGGSWDAVSKTATEYGQVYGAHTVYSATENNYRQVVPTAGTIKNFYVKLSEDPGVDPDAYRFTVRLNGATVAQSLIVTITADDTTGNDLAHNLAVVAGDILTLMIEPLNAPLSTVYAVWGMTFVADIDGESIVLGGSDDDLHAATTEYYVLTSYEGGAWTSIESQRYQLGQICTLKKLYILLSDAPGAGTSYTFTVRIGGADSNVVAVVAGAATTGNSAALEDTVANDDYVNLQVAPSGAPTVRDAYWGLVCYIAWAGKISGVTNPAEVMGVSAANIAKVKGVA